MGTKMFVQQEQEKEENATVSASGHLPPSPPHGKCYRAEKSTSANANVLVFLRDFIHFFHESGQATLFHLLLDRLCQKPTLFIVLSLVWGDPPPPLRTKSAK